jgi:alanine racemase
MRKDSFLHVYLDRLSQNLEKIRTLAPKANILPMVKANAYGHGLVPISEYLITEEKMTHLGCATRGEAIKLWQELEDFKGKVWVFSDTDILDSKAARTYLETSTLPVLHRYEHIERVVKDSDFKYLPLVIKLNTGMNRLGVEKDEWEKTADLLKRHGRKEIHHLLTHFSVSFHPLKPQDRTQRQYEEFNEAKKFFQAAGIHVASTSVSNSGAIEQKFGANESMIRPGIMMYGPGSVGNLWNGECISELKTVVMKKFKAKRGTPIGYGINVLPEDATILVLPIGYGDGLFTFWSGVEFQLKKYKAKVFGRVNMDMAFIQLPVSAYEDFSIGEEISFWGKDWKEIVELGNQMKTHPYQIFCALSDRLSRVYQSH